MPRVQKKSKTPWTAPKLVDFNVVSKKRSEPDSDVVDAIASEPRTVGDLAVNPRKVAEVRQWVVRSIGERAPILLVCGPPGSGKTTTLKLVAESEGFSVVEWISPVSKNVIGNFLEENLRDKGGFFDQSEGKKFEDFVNRSSRYPSLFQPKKRSLVLVKDVPNTFIWKPELFICFLQRYRSHGKSPIAFIVTDDENLDLHSSLFPNDLKIKLSITVIKFNPVSDTFLKKNLKNLAEKLKGNSIPQDCLERITKLAVGDLRSATTEVLVQLRTGELNSQTSKRRKHNLASEKEKVPSDPGHLSSRDHGYDFYKKMGRVLYPKRITDDPKNSAFVHNVMEIAENWSRSNLSFLHENYLQTVSKLEDAAAAADCFSFSDVLSRPRDMDLTAGIVTVAGLMTANSEPKKSGFLPFKKSVNLDRIKEWKCTFNEACVARFGVEERVFAVDIAPLKKWLSIKEDPSIRKLFTGGKEGGAQEKAFNFIPPQPVIIKGKCEENEKMECDMSEGDMNDSSESSDEEFEIEVDDD